ncbi:MAG: CapA family protein [Desulfomonilaceae bacterium]
MNNAESKTFVQPSETARLITLFLCGDVMTGRGIDQVLPHHSNPVLYESYVKDARDYVHLAERVSGPIPKPVGYSYIWGDALAVLERMAPDFRIINLETSITTSEDYWRDKGINYRMHPKNVPCITAAKTDLCVLANNHVLDWGYAGLIETLETLKTAGVQSAGAGRNLEEAGSPGVLEAKEKGRIIVFSFGSPTSGIPLSWAASTNRPGVNLLNDLSEKTIQSVETRVKELKRPGDIVIVSVHWGGNWGYGIPREQVAFAHNLIDRAGIDLIHGHSSHHVLGIEVYNSKLVLYGCGDFLNDYEGIGGHVRFRGDLGLMYFVSLAPLTGKLVHLRMVPTQIRNFKVNLASRADTLWLSATLDREGAALGTSTEVSNDNTLTLQWPRSFSP